jgi:hypothetical protein
LKVFIKKLIPLSILKWRRSYILKRELRLHDDEFALKKPVDVFSKIYKEKRWGGGADYFSGHGSHLQDHVDPYVTALSEFLGQFPKLLNVVDLGCGDFNVGRQIRGKAANYIACDIVPDLIKRNRQIYSELNVDFRILDMTQEDLPKGDVVLIRQVLQHLSNADIKRVIERLHGYKYLVLTEYVPHGEFIQNIDHITGSYSRLARGIPSGVVLTAPPFNLQVKSEKLICRTLEQEGLLTVIVYEL